MSEHALESARLHAGRDRTELLLEVTRRFTSTLEMSEVLSQVLTLTVDAIGAERGSIFVLNEAGQVIEKILARWYLPPAQSNEVISVVLRQGAAGYVYRTCKPVLIADTRADDRWLNLPDDPYITRSALCVPLLYRGRLNGILTITHARPEMFDEEDLSLAISIAGQAAIAVENASLFDRVRSERATLQAVVGSVVEGVLITDVEGRVLYVNPAGAAALGIQAGSVREQHLDDVASEPRLRELVRALLDGGGIQRGEVRGHDGRVYEASLVQVPGAGVVTTLHDVTHFKESEALKSEFVATVSHDLKSPLGLIYGYAWVLSEMPDLDAATRHHVQMILDGIQRMQQLINGLLDLTLIESGVEYEQELVDLSELVHEALSAFSAEVENKALQVTVDLPPDVPMIRGQVVRLGQAVSNLISNAVKYTPPEGRVEISVRVEGGEIAIRVADSGPGIPEDKQAKLFAKFYKVSSKATIGREGHGLGLAIVKSVAEAHGGRVTVKSKAGAGAVFGLFLPMTLSVDVSEGPTDAAAV